MKEIVHLNFGQAGVQIGSQYWELMCQEYGLNLDGTLNTDAHEQNIDSLHQMFYETKDGKFTPFSIFMDTDPEPINKIKISKLKNLFSSDYFVSGKEDTSNIFAYGFYTTGLEIYENAEITTRKLIEKCDRFQGFLSFYSTIGGTGSGFCSAYYQQCISLDYRKQFLNNFCIYPSSSNTTETPLSTYNTLLSLHSQIEFSSCNVLFDNSAIQNAITTQLGIEYPTFTDINQIICLQASNFLSNVRNTGTNAIDMQQILSSLIPYPRLRLCANSISLQSKNSFKNQLQKNNLDLCPISNTFTPNSFLISIDPSKGRYLSCFMVGRGENNHLSKYSILQRLDIIKNDKLLFNGSKVIPSGIKLSLREEKLGLFKNKSHQEKCQQSQFSLFAQQTALKSKFEELLKKFDKLFNSRAYLHWYRQKMSNKEFSESRDEAIGIIEDFKEVQNLDSLQVNNFENQN